MSDAVVVWLFDDVGVVASSFDDTWVGPMPTAFGAPFVDFGQGFS
jgi:hypothetical protein